MPPKKRSAAAAGGTDPAAKRKKISGSGTSVVGEPDASETHASGHPKRSSMGEPTYNAAAAKKSSAKPEVTGPSSSKTTVPAATRGRGRAQKDATAQTEEEHPPAIAMKSPRKPTGRSRKSGQTTEKATPSPNLVDTPPPAKRSRPQSMKTNGAAAPSATEPVDKSKGRTKNTKAKGKPVASKAKTLEKLDGLTANKSDGDEAEEDEGKQYWLMKAEPNSRLENGVDVKFSIDDLMNAKEPEGWDGIAKSLLQDLPSMLTWLGVRNAVARNRMRAMKKGDLAFFYHSNTKVPGVAGIMEIVEEHSIDGMPAPN